MNWTEQLWSCVAHPCGRKRVAKSGFCAEHKKEMRSVSLAKFVASKAGK